MYLGGTTPKFWRFSANQPVGGSFTSDGRIKVDRNARLLTDAFET